MSQLMAHRGARNLWAENSAFGFRETIKHNFDGVEFDVHLTNDGQLIVIHDALLDRTTNASGPVRNLTDETRKTVRLKGPDGALIDEGVPTLEEVLDIFAPTTTELYVELKADEQGNAYTGLVEKAAEILRDYGVQQRASLHSFDINVVREIADKAPDFGRLISVNADWAQKQGGIENFIKEVADLVDIVGIHHELFEAEYDLITSLLPMSKVSVWTLNEPDLMRRWIDRQPQWLVSDNPVLLREMMQKVDAA